MKNGRRNHQRLSRIEPLEPRHLLAAQVVVSELMADNEDFLLDEDGDSSDWIELRNLGDEAIDLGGWFLSDDPESLDKWELPSVNLDADGSLVVFASGKDRSVGELHTNFQLGRHGEHALIVQPDGATVESALSPYPFLPENVSFGRANDLSPGYFSDPTPGAANSALTLETGVVVSEIAYSPEIPVDGEDVIVTAKVDLSQGAPSAVNLQYRVGFGNEFSVVMQDFGSGDDAVAGDGIYTATISDVAFNAGDMVRWSVTTEDSGGLQTRNPLWDASIIDRNNAPEYFGTMIAADNVDSDLPVLQWFLQPGQESAARSRSGTRTSVFYAGELYDNVFVRVRGGSTAGLPKNSFKFDFNQGYHFQFDERYGRASEINLNTTFPDKAYIRQNLAFEVYNSVGAAGSVAFPMRVQRNGEFFSVATFIEQPDDDLLLREGLDPNGALYKMFNAFTSATSNVEKKTRQFESNGDLAAFISGMNASGASLRNFAFDHVDMPAVINYLVATVLTQNNDQQKKNYFLYRDTNGTGEWTMLPWDLDLTFGRHYMTRDNILDDELWADEDNILGGRSNNVPISPSHPYAGEQEHPGNRSWNRLIDKLYEMPEFREMFLRRLRTAMDELLLPPGTPTEQLVLDNRIDELVAQIGADATLDFDEWADPWSYGQNLTIQQAAQKLKDEYLAIRREHLYVTHNVDNLGQPEIVGIPHAQTSQASANIVFGDVEFDPASGNQDEEYIELANTGGDAVDISGWRLAGGVSHVFKPGTVIRSGANLFVSPNVNAFRGRSASPRGGQGHLVQGNYEGRLSAAGEQVQLLDANGNLMATFDVPDTRSDIQKFLRVSELNYNPIVADDGSEFIEVANISRGPDALTLDISGVVISDGPSSPMVFPSGTTLGPGEFLVAVKDEAVFRATYPGVDSSIIVGEFTGSLSNGGERIRLDDADGNKIVDFEYNDQDPWAVRADGSGASLELTLDGIDENTPVDRHYRWRGSVRPGGSPGTAGETPIGVVVNEVLTNSDSHLDAIELVNTSNEPVMIGGWYLSDSDNNFFKFQIPAGITLQPGEYVVFDESDFNPTPDTPAANHFALNGSEGDDVWMVTREGSQVGQFIDDVHFPGVTEDRTLGRVDNASGRMVPTSRNTLGCQNRTWHVSEVVISEVQFAPLPPSVEATTIFPGIDSGDLEFIELTNQSNEAIDVGGWEITGGVEFELPAGTLLGAGQSLIVVPFDVGNVGLLEAFLANYDASNTTVVVGGYSGSLNNSGEAVQLLATDVADPAARVLVDEVVYDDLPPWQNADETGQSLSRVSGLSLGNAAESWWAVSPSPGRADLQSVVAGDLTGDGLLDGSDIDALFDAVASGTFADELDLNGDMVVNDEDVTYLVESLMNSLYGDANLDGVVDVSDFGIWNSNKFTGCTGWANADFNGDMQTDVSDFNIWNGRKFTSADSAFASRESRDEDETRSSVSSTIDRVFEFETGSSGTENDFQR